MKRLSFKKVYIDSILDGEKTTTLRRWTGIEPGDEVAATCEWGKPPFAVLEVSAVDEVRLAKLSDEDARDDGFEDRLALRKALAKFYPDAEVVSRIRFTVKRVPRSGSSGSPASVSSASSSAGASRRRVSAG